ncbi:MAG: cation:proton antiporter [Rhizobiaceae bacterium]|nr:cation:proton antiporter [Rhizobiaceae bacterium]
MATPEVYTQTVILLGGAVLAAPVSKKLGLGTVLGYLIAGLVLGPVLGIVSNGERILHFAELGIVFLLFILGLEMRPSRLWAMRRDILGLGTTQVMFCGLMLTTLGMFIAPTFSIALVGGFGLALSSTAYVLQTLETRKEFNTAYGQKSFSVLLFQDIAIIPMLAIVPLLSNVANTGSDWSAFLIGVGAIAIVLFAGRYLLNPLLRVIARTGAHEAMIATALLVVFGAAMLMQAAGLSMALGSFLAGVLLAESSFKLELEANIEPFRGILLGLFFMAVGLSLNIDILLENWLAIIACVLVAMLVKSACIFLACRAFGTTVPDSIRAGAILSQHGEFGFVLFASALSIGVLGPKSSSFLIAMVVLSMAMTPLSVWLGGKLITYLHRDGEEAEMQEDFSGAGRSPVLMIGFSRIGQIAAQALLAAGVDVTIIDNNPNTIRNAARFGFRIYFGNGARKEVLVAAGIKDASIVAICTHLPETTNRIVDIVASEFPDVEIYARAYDRRHTLQLMDKPVKFHTRETFESALILGEAMLEGLGKSRDEAEQIIEEVRELDKKRLQVQYREGLYAGSDIMHSKPVQPEPLVEPQHEAELLDPRSREVVGEGADDESDNRTREDA